MKKNISISKMPCAQYIHVTHKHSPCDPNLLLKEMFRCKNNHLLPQLDSDDYGFLRLFANSHFRTKNGKNIHDQNVSKEEQELNPQVFSYSQGSKSKHIKLSNLILQVCIFMKWYFILGAAPLKKVAFKILSCFLKQSQKPDNSVSLKFITRCLKTKNG